MVERRRVKITTKQIIEDFNIVHGDTYDYSKVSYKTMHKKVTIVCKLHGEFEQTPNAHIRQKQGCRKCSDIKNHNRKRDCTTSFINKAKLIHGDTYNYDKTVYGKTSHDKVIITCSIHGDFIIRPNRHISKEAGCKYCGFNKLAELNKISPTGWSLTNWIKASKNSIDFESFKVYVIQCFNNDETFFKIGRTFRPIHKRFWGNRAMPYKYKIINVYEGEPEEMYNLETKLKRLNKINKHSPKIPFKGMEECYSLITTL